MNSKNFIESWVFLFNAKDADGLAELYHHDAINHQVANETIVGKDNSTTLYFSYLRWFSPATFNLVFMIILIKIANV